MSNEKQDINETMKLTVETTPEPEKAVTQSDDVAEDAAREEENHPTLTEVIKEQATEDDAPLSKNITLRKILGGDILTTSTIRRQIWTIVLITFFIIIYITNRYSCEQSLIKQNITPSPSAASSPSDAARATSSTCCDKTTTAPCTPPINRPIKFKYQSNEQVQL